MTADGGVEGALTLARRRLEASVAALEARLAQRRPANAFADEDRERLEAELETSRARERDMAAASAQASEALTRAIADIRAALGTG
ncbi:hypothetical protein ACO2Q3_26805 [Caulobacter sp. KR2-114]|uniref:hypothetical protein n=1 Tax=Caulobacter sp. KR2-114 TaxID=3400912 RepID=UPI003BFD8995